MKGSKYKFTCMNCGASINTIEADHGYKLTRINCFQPECDGIMLIASAPLPKSAPVKYEWFRPALVNEDLIEEVVIPELGFSEDYISRITHDQEYRAYWLRTIRDHVAKGGLLIRRIQEVAA